MAMPVPPLEGGTVGKSEVAIVFQPGTLVPEPVPVSVKNFLVAVLFPGNLFQLGVVSPYIKSPATTLAAVVSLCVVDKRL